MMMYNQFVSLNQISSEDLVVQDQIRDRIAKQHALQVFQSSRHSRVSSRQHPRHKIIIAANRLPITLSKPKPTEENPNAGWTAIPSSGGLVSGLSAVKGFDMIWIGWPGLEVEPEDRPAVLQICKNHSCYPVWLSQELIDLYYNGFSNNVIWPLFHYVMPPLPSRGVSESTNEQWNAYVEANTMFAEAIYDNFAEDDFVWVHDYHLMLVPKILRDRLRGEDVVNVNIGWFLHTPFPASEYYRVLKVREELLHGVLSANLVGFHVYDYIRHFIQAVVQLTSLETTPQGVDATPLGGCVVRCATMPIGIDPKEFVNKLQTDEVKEWIRTLSEEYIGKKVILGVDRLDYMKGIPHKLKAFDRFLIDNPEWIGQCVLVQVAVPSRLDVAEYQKLKKTVHEMVGDISGRHSTISSGSPVVYLDQAMDSSQLTALYRIADVCFITSLRDGMNLVSYEYLACQEDLHGVLILSEFCGSSQSLGAASVRINPWNLRETSEAIRFALTLGPEDRAARYEYGRRQVYKYTAQKWAETFIQTLKEASLETEETIARVPALLPYEELLDELSTSKKRLIIVDLLDCLVPSTVKKNLPMKLYQSLLVVPSQVMEAVATLARDPDTYVVIVTIHQRAILERLFGHLPVVLAPENGCTYRGIDGNWHITLGKEAIDSVPIFMPGVVDMMQYFKERTPGSYTEKQDYSISFFHDNTQSDFGAQQARDLLIHLLAGPLMNAEAEFVIGSRQLTIRPNGCGRASNMQTILSREFGDQILDDVDFCCVFAEVPFRDDSVFEAIEKLLLYGCEEGEEGGEGGVGGRGGDMDSPERMKTVREVDEDLDDMDESPVRRGPGLAVRIAGTVGEGAGDGREGGGENHRRREGIIGKSGDGVLGGGGNRSRANSGDPGGHDRNDRTGDVEMTDNGDSKDSLNKSVDRDRGTDNLRDSRENLRDSRERDNDNSDTREGRGLDSASPLPIFSTNLTGGGGGVGEGGDGVVAEPVTLSDFIDATGVSLEEKLQDAPNVNIFVSNENVDAPDPDDELEPPPGYYEDPSAVSEGEKGDNKGENNNKGDNKGENNNVSFAGRLVSSGSSKEMGGAGENVPQGRKSLTLLGGPVGTVGDDGRALAPLSATRLNQQQQVGAGGSGVGSLGALASSSSGSTMNNEGGEMRSREEGDVTPARGIGPPHPSNSSFGLSQTLSQGQTSHPSQSLLSLSSPGLSHASHGPLDRIDGRIDARIRLEGRGDGREGRGDGNNDSPSPTGMGGQKSSTSGQETRGEDAVAKALEFTYHPDADNLLLVTNPAAEKDPDVDQSCIAFVVPPHYEEEPELADDMGPSPVGSQPKNARSPSFTPAVASAVIPPGAATFSTLLPNPNNPNSNMNSNINNRNMNFTSEGPPVLPLAPVGSGSTTNIGTNYIRTTGDSPISIGTLEKNLEETHGSSTHGSGVGGVSGIGGDSTPAGSVPGVSEHGSGAFLSPTGTSRTFQSSVSGDSQAYPNQNVKGLGLKGSEIVPPSAGSGSREGSVRPGMSPLARRPIGGATTGSGVGGVGVGEGGEQEASSGTTVTLPTPVVGKDSGLYEAFNPPPRNSTSDVGDSGLQHTGHTGISAHDPYGSPYADTYTAPYTENYVDSGWSARGVHGVHGVHGTVVEQVPWSGGINGINGMDNNFLGPPITMPGNSSLPHSSLALVVPPYSREVEDDNASEKSCNTPVHNMDSEDWPEPDSFEPPPPYELQAERLYYFPLGGADRRELPDHLKEKQAKMRETRGERTPSYGGISSGGGAVSSSTKNVTLNPKFTSRSERQEQRSSLGPTQVNKNSGIRGTSPTKLGHASVKGSRDSLARFGQNKSKDSEQDSLSGSLPISPVIPYAGGIGGVGVVGMGNVSGGDGNAVSSLAARRSGSAGEQHVSYPNHHPRDSNVNPIGGILPIGPRTDGNIPPSRRSHVSHVSNDPSINPGMIEDEVIGSSGSPVRMASYDSHTTGVGLDHRSQDGRDHSRDGVRDSRDGLRDGVRDSRDRRIFSPARIIPIAPISPDKMDNRENETLAVGDSATSLATSGIPSGISSSNSNANLAPPSEENNLGTSRDNSKLSYFSVSLGKKVSQANYSLPHPYHLQNLMRSIAEKLAETRDPEKPDRQLLGTSGGDSGQPERSRAVIVGPEAFTLTSQNDYVE